LLRAVIVKVTVLPSVGLAVLTVLVTARSAWNRRRAGHDDDLPAVGQAGQEHDLPAPLIPEPQRLHGRAERRVALADDQVGDRIGAGEDPEGLQS